jgi:hypothetical protein
LKKGVSRIRKPTDLNSGSQSSGNGQGSWNAAIVGAATVEDPSVLSIATKYVSIGSTEQSVRIAMEQVREAPDSPQTDDNPKKQAHSTKYSTGREAYVGLGSGIEMPEDAEVMSWPENQEEIFWPVGDDSYWSQFARALELYGNDPIIDESFFSLFPFQTPPS